MTTAWIIGRSDYMGTDVSGTFRYESMSCPECKRLTVQLIRNDSTGETRTTLWPHTSTRPPAPQQVPEAIRQDYIEACLVLPDSPKASAALSRRCLQHILREAAGVKAGTLSSEIDQAISSKQLPSPVAASLGAVREIGNFAAHPTKSKNSGDIIDVELGEAEWNLDVVEALMDVLYVQPATLAAKKAALNVKLADAGKTQIP